MFEAGCSAECKRRGLICLEKFEPQMERNRWKLSGISVSISVHPRFSPIFMPGGAPLAGKAICVETNRKFGVPGRRPIADSWPWDRRVKEALID